MTSSRRPPVHPSDRSGRMPAGVPPTCPVAGASVDPVSSPVINYRGTFRIPVAPHLVWDAVERTDEFERWWGWLGEFHFEGPGLQAGSVLTGVVSPPLPYHMRVRVELEDCVKPLSIEAAVHGDLEGHASLRLAPEEAPALSETSSTIASVSWTIEMMQRPMRVAARVAYPLLCWGHDRVVDATVSSFRRQIEHRYSR
jgi:hypothetical protein